MSTVYGYGAAVRVLTSLLGLPKGRSQWCVERRLYVRCSADSRQRQRLTRHRHRPPGTPHAPEPPPGSPPKTPETRKKRKSTTPDANPLATPEPAGKAKAHKKLSARISRYFACSSATKKPRRPADSPGAAAESPPEKPPPLTV